MSPIFLLAAQNNIDNFHHPSWLLTCTRLLSHFDILGCDQAPFLRRRPTLDTSEILQTSSIRVSLQVVMSSDEAKIDNEETSRQSRWKFIIQYCPSGSSFRLLFVYVKYQKRLPVGRCQVLQEKANLMHLWLWCRSCHFRVSHSDWGYTKLPPNPL